MCDIEDALCRELREKGYKSMSEMTKNEEELLEKVVNLIEREFHIRFTAKDLSIKKIICDQCGEEAFCIHIHNIVSGSRHPDFKVDVDDFIEICTSCGIKHRMYDETYETNPDLRIRNCPFCNRQPADADLKIFNKTCC